MRNLYKLLLASATILSCTWVILRCLKRDEVIRAVGKDGCCPACGTPIPARAKWCCHCGTLLNWRKEDTDDCR